jgi:cytochrome c oxidase assembly protein subunit 15
MKQKNKRTLLKPNNSHNLVKNNEDSFLARYWFIAAKQHGSRLALVTFLLAFVVILLGAYTRLTDAGLSCPDWPHCYGYVTAPHTSSQLAAAAENYPDTPVEIKKAWTEMTHRYFAGGEGILIFILAFSLVWQKKSPGNRHASLAKWMAIILLALLCIQVMLGMLTVTAKLKPIIVLGHLLTGIALLTMLWWVYLDSRPCKTPFHYSVERNMKPWLWLGFFILLAQISLGGWVSTHYAGLACIDFPYCNGELLPALHLERFNEDLITIHMLHRIGAAITGIYILLLSLMLLAQPSYRWIGILFLVLMSGQIMLGILNILWLRPVWLALLHQAGAILLLLTTVGTLVKSYSLTGHYDAK